jgi:sirohydrochlorin cobaltochelatase
MTKTTIVLAMHGAPPNDFPPHELAEFFGLHGRLEGSHGHVPAAVQQRHDELDAKMRAWPRSTENDPFFYASQELAKALAKSTGFPVEVGFNEFCAPSLAETFDQVAATGAEQVIVVTPMMTRGGEHAEQDIPAAIQQAQTRHPHIDFRYAWPFGPSQVAEFLAAHLHRFI